MLIVCQKVQLVFIDLPHYIYAYVAHAVFRMLLNTLINRSEVVVAVVGVIFSTDQLFPHLTPSREKCTVQVVGQILNTTQHKLQIKT